MSAACCVLPRSRRLARAASAVKSRPTDLTAVENAAIEQIIARQAEVGLRSATDGEFRRAMWHFDFLERLDGVESFRSDHGIAFKGGIETQAKGLRVVGKVGFSGHPMLEHFRFLRDHTRATPKMTIPSPQRAALPRRASRRQPGCLPGDGRVLPRSWGRPIAAPCRRSPTPAAATCNSTKSTWPICATPSSGRCCATAATIRTACPRSTRT